MVGGVKIRDITVSPLALGTWAIGGGRDWGQSDPVSAREAILKALESGINFIDTAPIYGNYFAEELLGKTLKGRRQQVVITTKCGLLPGQRAVKRCLKPESVRAECEASLKRLCTEYIDFYLLHWPDRDTPLSDTLAELARLKQQGKIRRAGVCNFSAALLEEAAKITDIAIVQNEYSYLSAQKGLEVFDVCKKYNIAFIAYGVLAGGVLSGKYKEAPCLPRCDARSFFYNFYKGDSFKTASAAAARLGAVAKKYGASAAQAAINWSLANPAVTCAAAGARTSAQAADIAAAQNWRLTKEDLDFLNG
jgi:aryl-alcohol dehydrogenase-like predicted oxidoreductase